MDNEGISRELIVAFLVYLIGHNRPIAELLAPRAKPLADLNESEFKGMTFNDEECLSRLFKWQVDENRLTGEQGPVVLKRSSFLMLCCS